MLKTEIKISDVLHLAADKYLAKDAKESTNGKLKFSCIAIEFAVEDLLGSNWTPSIGKLLCKIQRELLAMGCECTSCSQFRHLEKYNKIRQEFEATPESQAARYFWLKWAALMAEENAE